MMTSNSHLYCSPCGYENVNKGAMKWCANCEEGLCEDCSKVHKKTKLSINHKLISTDDYKKISYLSVCQICEDHGKTLDKYCRTHDSVLCPECTEAQHLTCPDIVLLDDVAKSAKRSTAVPDLEKAISDVLKNVQSIVQDQSKELTTFMLQEKMIQNKIGEIRLKITKHFDKLEESMLSELKRSFQKCKAQQDAEKKHLENAESIMLLLRDQTKQMKQFASDVQIFLITRKANEKVLETLNTVVTKCSTLKTFSAQFKINPVMNSVFSKIKRFGDLDIEVKETKLPALRPKNGQIPLKVPVLVKTNVDDVQVSLKKNFSIKKETSYTNITGCVILPDGQLIVADFYGNNQLMVYDQDGTHIREIPVSSKPFGITFIDQDRIAASYGALQYIEIVNIKDGIEENKINLGSATWGLSYQDGKLYVVVRNRGIIVMDLSGNVVNTLTINVDNVNYITTTTDRIYYSDYGKHSVVCCDMTGKQIWEFKDESLVKPHGLTVDKYQNVFVAGATSKTVAMISHDGKTSKTLLTSSEGLTHPRAIFYRQDQRLLLVCNQNSDKAALYNVICD